MAERIVCKVGPGGKGSKEHFWRFPGPFWRYSAASGNVSLATHGRTCYWCKAEEPDFRICAEMVTTYDHLFSETHRCERRGEHLSSRKPSSGPMKGVAAVDGTWAYCTTHSPERAAERDAKRRLTEYELTSLRHAREDALRRAVEAWDRDEAATEGFCDEDTACEHHECRLHRILLQYRAPSPKTKGDLAAYKAANPIYGKVY